MPRARVRRPLIALIVLVAALVIGYTVRAVQSDHTGPSQAPPTHSPQPSISRSR